MEQWKKVWGTSILSQVVLISSIKPISSSISLSRMRVELGLRDQVHRSTKLALINGQKQTITIHWLYRHRLPHQLLFFVRCIRQQPPVFRPRLRFQNSTEARPCCWYSATNLLLGNTPPHDVIDWPHQILQQRTPKYDVTILALLLSF